MYIDLGFMGRGSDSGPDVSRSSDSVIIDCRRCRLTPVPGSDECIRCMVDAVCAHGGSGRIVLRTGRDLEVSGAAGRAIGEVASIKRWSSDTPLKGTRGRGCRVSRAAVMDAAWRGFPRNAAFEGRRVLKEGAPDRDECRTCVMRTSKALEQMDSGIRRVVRGMGPGGEVPP